MAADVTIQIDGDASGLVAAANQGAAALRPLSQSIERVNHTSAQAAGGARALSRELDDVKNVLKLLNPAFGEMGERFGGALRVFEGGASRMVALGASVGAVSIALAAVTAGAVAFGAAVIRTSRDVDTLADSLTDSRRAALEPHIAALEDANLSFNALEDAVTSLQIVMASEYVDTLADAAVVTAYLMGNTDRLVDVLQNAAGVIARGFANTPLANMFGFSPTMVTAISAAGTATSAMLDSTAEGLRDVLAEIEKGEQIKAALAADKKPGASARRTSGAAAREDADAFADAWKSGFDAWVAAHEAAIAEEERQRLDFYTSVVTEGRAASEAETLAVLEAKGRQIVAEKELQEYRKKLARERIEMEKAVAAERIAIEREYMAAGIGLTQQYVGAVSGLVGTLAEAQGASAEEIWQINHAAAVAQAALAIPLAALQGLSSGGPAAPALAAAYAGLAAIEFAAVVAQQPPQFHIGGMLAPDEYAGNGYIGRRNETQIGPALLTAQGADALFGGARGLAELNAGRGPEPAPIYLVVDGEPRRARPFAGPTPGYGRTQFGGR